MTSKEFAFNYAGKEFMFYGDRVIVVGYDSMEPGLVLVSPVELRTVACFWEGLTSGDIITYSSDRTTYRYVQIRELKPVPEERPQTVVKVKPKTVVKVKPKTVVKVKPKTVVKIKPKTPGECIAYYEGQQGMNYSVVNGCVYAVYKRQGSALKLVSRGDGINNVTEKI